MNPKMSKHALSGAVGGRRPVFVAQPFRAQFEVVFDVFPELF
jgi:hypothetical protein